MYAAAVLVSYGFGDVGGHVESLDMVFLSLRYGSLGENDTSHTCLGLRNKCLGMHILSYMSKFTRILFHLAVLCDSLRCGAYGTYCYGIS